MQALSKAPSSRAGTRQAGARPAARCSVRAAGKQQPQQQQQQPQPADEGVKRREFVLCSFSAPLVLSSLLNIGAVERPSNLGIQDYGGGVRTLALCPSTPNCIATSEESNDESHYVPPWTYAPQDGRGGKGPIPPEQAMSELVDVVTSTKPDGFEPKIVKQDKDFLYVEYSSPTFGFIDDVEFWLKPGDGARVEYRSASRIGESDGNINRKRIRALREQLTKRFGWASTGY